MNEPAPSDSPPRPLRPEETQAFADLGLTPGDWQALHVLPLLEAVRRTEPTLRPNADDWLGKPAETVPSIIDWRRQFVPDSKDAVSPRLALGLSLLAWHLATDRTYSQREEFVQQMQERMLSFRNRCPKAFADAAQEEVQALRERIDAHLPCATFTMEPPSEAAASPWRLLLLAPMLELFAAEANVALEGIGLPLSLKPVESPDVVEAARRELVSLLAALPWRQRETLFTAASEHAAGLVKKTGYFSSSPLFARATLVQLAAALRRAVAEARFALRPAIVEAPPPTPEPTTPVEVIVEAPRPGPVEVAPPLVVEVAPPPVVDEAAPPLADDGADFVEPVRFATISWETTLAEADAMTLDKVRQLIGRPLLFEECCGESPKVAIVRDANHPALRCLWFVGDLHGDVLALANAWHYLESWSRSRGLEPHAVFLGDFVDRGRHSHETLMYLFRLIHDNPGRIGVLPGNHDESFFWDDSANVFRPGVMPAEYPDGLNELVARDDADSRERLEVGKLVCQFFRERPRALMLPDGLLAAHAGFPHTDLHERLTSLADLSSEACLQDFVWLRLSANAKRKRPHRNSRGCEYGYDDFAEFGRLMESKLGVPVRRLVRGHDHVQAKHRYEIYPRYQTHPALTINTMGHRMDDESDMLVPEFARGCVARHRLDRLPQVHSLPIDEAAIRAASAMPAELFDPSPFLPS